MHLDYVDCVRWLGNLLITKRWEPRAASAQRLHIPYHTIPSLCPHSSAPHGSTRPLLTVGCTPPRAFAKRATRATHALVVARVPAALSSRRYGCRACGGATMRRRMGAGMQGRRGWRTGEVVLQWGVSRGWRGGCNPPCSVLVCAELHYTNSQIWFIRFDVDQSNKLVCVGNQTGEIFIWMLSGTEFVQVFFCGCAVPLRAHSNCRSVRAAARSTPRACGRRLWRRQVRVTNATAAVGATNMC